MFGPGQVIYFNEFFFKNGNTSKAKYLIILGIFENKTIVASLPTRKNNAPSLINRSHGCINIDDRMFNCYAFEPGRPVCVNGFFFPLPTFIYGNQVEDYQVEIFEEIYKIEGVDYEVMGTLTNTELQAVVHCIVNSAGTRQKIKRMLR